MIASDIIIFKVLKILYCPNQNTRCGISTRVLMYVFLDLQVVLNTDPQSLLILFY